MDNREKTSQELIDEIGHLEKQMQAIKLELNLRCLFWTEKLGWVTFPIEEHLRAKRRKE